LLYHQTMSTLMSQGELSPASLAQQVLTLPPFKNIQQSDYRQLLRHWIDLNHIETTEKSTLILGLKGEKLVRNFKFYAIFPDNEEYRVMNGDRVIGSIMVAPETGDRISLAGSVWEITEVNQKSKVVKAKSSSKSANASSWRGTTGDIHTKVLAKMRQILREDTKYSYLQQGAIDRLQLARETARRHGLTENLMVYLEDGYVCLFPWIGSKAFRSLERYLRNHCRSLLNIKGVKGRSPYFLTVNLGQCPAENLLYELQSVADQSLTSDMFMEHDETPTVQKYDSYILPDLIRQQFVTDGLAMDELAQVAQGWRSN
jgi:ATP-dependent helicase Lhr and Lhr-like helicase